MGTCKAATCLQVVIKALIFFSFLAFILIQVFKPLLWFRTGAQWATATANVSIRNHAQLPLVSKTLATSAGFILSPNSTQQVIWTLSPVLVAAVCAILLFHFDPHPQNKPDASVSSRTKLMAKRILFFELYPRRFWIWLCGGLHVLDFILVLTWLAFNIMWCYFTVQPKYVSIRAQIAQGKTTAYAGHLNMLHQTASSIGTATMFSMTLLFFPVPRNSFLHYIFNTDFSGMLKYHRWLGYGMAWTAILHGLLYYVYWSLKGGFYSYWSKWGNDHSNNLAGSIAMIFLVLILVTSMQWVRRMYFQVFIRCHILGFVGFTVFTYIHYWQRWWYQSAGLILLALDWAFRLAQYLDPAFVTGHFVAADKTIITLSFTWRKMTEVRPGYFMFLNMPTGCRWQWHPVTVADVQQQRPGITVITAHMKVCGAWTTEMTARMLEKGKLLMRVDGPYGRPYGPGWQAHEVLVIFAGGIGVTPMLGMLREMVSQRRRQRELLGSAADLRGSIPSKVYLIWSCRGMSEFALLDDNLLDAQLDEETWLEIQLHTTRANTRLDTELLCDMDGMNEPIRRSRVVRLPTKTLLPLGHGTATASPFFVRPGVLEAYGSGSLLIAAHLLAFVGAFFAMLMSAAYDSNLGLTTGNNKQDWRTAMLVLAGGFVGGMGLPALVILLYRCMRRMWQRDLALQARKYQADLGCSDNSDVMISNHKVGAAGEGALVSVIDGRPAIAEKLAYLVAEHWSLVSIGVFASGPQSMIAEVQLTCASLNDRLTSPYCAFSSHAFEL